VAWFLAHRIREAMADPNPGAIGGGGKVVEADETYIGGKAKNRALTAASDLGWMYGCRAGPVGSSNVTAPITGVPLQAGRGSQNATSVVDGATIESRTRINRPVDESAKCKVSRAPGQPNDFSQRMQPSTTPSTSNAISFLHARTEPSEHRRCRRGVRSLPRREPNVPADLLRPLFGNVTEP
jgi:hypothetical protein